MARREPGEGGGGWPQGPAGLCPQNPPECAHSPPCHPLTRSGRACLLEVTSPHREGPGFPFRSSRFLTGWRPCLLQGRSGGRRRAGRLCPLCTCRVVASGPETRPYGAPAGCWGLCWGYGDAETATCARALGAPVEVPGFPRRQLLSVEGSPGLVGGAGTSVPGQEPQGGRSVGGKCSWGRSVLSGVGPGELTCELARDFGLEHGSQVPGMLLNSLSFLLSLEKAWSFALTWSSSCVRT